MKKNRFYNFNFILGLCITGFLLFLGLLSFFYTPCNPEGMNGSLKNAGCSLSHFFGCDNFGRDIFSRVMVGIRNTMFISLGTVGIGFIIGLVLGALSGYFGGIFDEIVMRINDTLFSFPSVLVALVVISIMGVGNKSVVIALGISFIPSFTRMVRAEFIRQRKLDYVCAAKLIGASDIRIIFIHIMPNVLPVTLQSVIIGFNNAVLAEAGLSFLGLGVQPPFSSLGRMLSEAQTFMFSSPHNALFPGIAVVLLVLGLSFLAEGVSDGQ